MLSKAQIQAEKFRFRKWFWIWERDLLELSRRFTAWRSIAHELGFQDEKIDAVWTFTDSGRHIKYMENPYFQGDLLGSS